MLYFGSFFFSSNFQKRSVLIQIMTTNFCRSRREILYMFLLTICFVQILRVARELGDFLLVGIHNDQTVRLQSSFLTPPFVHKSTLWLCVTFYLFFIIFFPLSNIPVLKTLIWVELYLYVLRDIAEENIKSTWINH